jgi:hypothetical protein
MPGTAITARPLTDVQRSSAFRAGQLMTVGAPLSPREERIDLHHGLAVAGGFLTDQPEELADRLIVNGLR